MGTLPSGEYGMQLATVEERDIDGEIAFTISDNVTDIDVLLPTEQARRLLQILQFQLRDERVT